MPAVGVERPGEPTGDAAWPRDELAAALGDEVAGLETIRMLIAHPRWVHRRIDALEYRDDTTFRRRQSVHFTVPAVAPEIRVAEARFRLVPLTTLYKETLVNFDCRDESGDALPVLTRTQQGMLAVRGMVEWAGGLVEAASAGSLAAEVVDEITVRVTSVGNGDGLARPDPPPGLTPAAEAQWAVLRADAFYSLVLDRLTDQFLLVTLVDDVPGTQRVLKFSYEELGEFASEPWPRGPLAALGWLPRRAASAAESLFSAESYHFEADLPPGIDVPVASLWVGESESDMACVDLDPGEHERIALRSPGYEHGVAEVRWSVWPARRGWLRTAWFATTLGALTLALGGWRLDTITAASGPEDVTGTVPAGTRTELAAAVILAVIGTLGGLVARIEEHPLVTRILEWPRRLAAFAAMLPFVAAGSLVVGPSGEGRRVLWAGLALLATVIAAIFTVAFIRPAATDPPPEPGPRPVPFRPAPGRDAHHGPGRAGLS